MLIIMLLYINSLLINLYILDFSTLILKIIFTKKYFIVFKIIKYVIFIYIFKYIQLFFVSMIRTFIFKLIIKFKK